MPAAYPMDYADLEIRILARVSEGYPVEITFSERQFPRGHLDPAVLPWIPAVSPEEEGERLFALLFGDPLLQAAWNEARGERAARRIRLRIDPEAPELHTIPWEQLCEASPGEPRRTLAAVPETPFSRYLAGAWRPREAVRERPLRLLVAIANPDGLAERGLEPLDAGAELREIEQALSEVDASELEVTVLEPPVTLPALEAALRRGPHMLHLIAHGRFSETSGKAALYLADEKNQLALARDEELAGLLGRQGDTLRLVFLASCQSATRSPADAFRGLAPQLIAAGMPAVVAMQDLVPIEMARTFAGTFYRQLLRHGLVDLAANEARSALLTRRLQGAAVPVLFLRLKNARLVGSRPAIPVLDERPASDEPGNASRRRSSRRLLWTASAAVLAVLAVLAIRWLPFPSRSSSPAPAVEIGGEPAPAAAALTEPVAAEPAPAEPALPEPAPAEIELAKLAPAEPAPAKPAPAEIELTKPSQAEPSPVEPTPAEPAPAEPVLAKSAPADVAPAEPATPEPMRAKPAPAEPAPAEVVPVAPELRGVTLYEHSDFRGRSETFYRDDARLHNNLLGQHQASSVRVPPGCTATLYRENEFRGTYVVLRADSPDLGQTWVGNDTVSSLEVSCRQDTSGDHGVTLYEHSDFRGRSELFSRDDPRLQDNPLGRYQASSVKVPPGCTVTLYQEEGFRGAFAILRADSPNLAKTSVGNDMVSSLEVGCQEAPGPALSCGYAGTFLGTYTGGDDRGIFLVVVDGVTGKVTGLAHSSGAEELEWLLTGAASRSRDQNTVLMSGTGSESLSFHGRFTSPDGLSGTWRIPSALISGSFAGDRVGAADATHRFAGKYGGDDFGVFALDVDRSDEITLVTYDKAKEELVSWSGRVVGTTLSVTAGDLTVTGTLDRDAGTMNGTWKSAGDGASATFTGVGCKLE